MVTDSRKRALDEEVDSLSSKKHKAPDGSPVASSPSSRTNDILEKAKAIARAKAAAAAKAMAAKQAQMRTVASPTPPQSASESGTPTSSREASAPADSSRPVINTKELLAQIAERKARIAAATAGRGSASSQSSSGRAPPSANTSFRHPMLDDSELKARGGLNVGVHPALLNDAQPTSSSVNKRQLMTPKFATTMANTKKQAPKKQLELLTKVSEDETDPTKNPYFDPDLEARPKERHRRALEFNTKGKYIELANELRTQARLEELKKRIQESSKKAGLDEELDVADMAMKREPPPDVEWWDQPLLANKAYDGLDDDSQLKLDGTDSVITIYVQHPIPINAPWEKNAPAVKPPYLTKKELKRIRKTDRAESHKDKQDRIRLGLDPAPPPKVKLSNLMSVLTNEAIKDPTLVEARVRREMEERRQKHLQDNLDRKLSQEQKHEKLKEKLQQDEKRGIICAIFRIGSLANPQHSYKINVNARELDLTGVTIVNPKFNVVVVEGGSRAIRLYKKLLLARIDWARDAQSISNPNEAASNGQQANMSDNKCELVWEGELKQHQFKRWNVRTTENEAEAREILERSHVPQYWNLAKNWKNDL
ncbi:pre-mRNA processing factor 3-domain-containing protein [Lipomyces kononenkoae]|uniref:Pre-mRNA processing factor 3-domain-containing protein n=1 Tax=Lipomyces kononenkoae TaxID=34357 RepID=A0ACC3TBD9_LIPKO